MTTPTTPTTPDAGSTAFPCWSDLRHGDCLAEMAKLPDGCVDMVLTDPPYGTTACKWDTVIPFDPMWVQLKRLAKKRAAIVLHASQPFTSALGASNLDQLRYAWVWEKTAATGHLNARRMPMKNAEDVLVFYGSQPTYNPQGTSSCEKLVRRSGNGDNYGRSGTVNIQTSTGYPRTILRFKSQRETNHPTQKPVAIAEYLIKTYTHPGMTVLDFTMGSGTTGVACKRLCRNFIGIELDAGYFEIAKKRIAEAEAYQPNGTLDRHPPTDHRAEAQGADK